VDARGFIYISEKNQGLWILQYTGPGEAGSPPRRQSRSAEFSKAVSRDRR